jgi:hypothetical protein
MPLAHRRGLLRAAAGLPLAAALPGCAIPPREPAVPRGQSGRATVLGLPNERFRLVLPEGQAAIEREFIEAQARQRRHLGLAPNTILPTLDMLAVSGGGENGAFGAGLLNGWTAHGNRPVFDLVTGVSTGALTAPFAYIGPSHDEPLKRVYTEISPERVLIRRWVTAAIFDDGLADTSPLFNTIAEYLDEAMLAAIARAYDEGRLLLIASADLDAQTPVIWNIGAIAKSGHPRALDTIRRILLASAAIPGAFPPVMFDVTVDGRPHQEMHVDGGTFVQAFLYPAVVTRARRERLARHQRVAPARAWIIRAGQGLDHPQRAARCGMGGGGPARHQHRRPRGGHHDGGQRLQRRGADVLRDPARRGRLQPGLHRHGLHRRVHRGLRAALHARAV